MQFATIAILAAFVGQTPKVDGRLEFMKAEAAAYRFAKAGNRAVPLTFREDPAFRLGKQPADNVVDGAIFLWLGEDGRPEASLQIFMVKHTEAPQPIWAHEFNSFSSESLLGTRRGLPSWSPRRPGVEYHRLDDVPKPAATAALRLRQMRAIMQNFKVKDYFKDKSWTELRLLPTPVARYGKEGAAVIDGALFAFVTGTDPEACVFLEARQGKQGAEWFYALAPLTCYWLKGSYKNAEVWDLPRRPDGGSASGPYFVFVEPATEATTP
jgi:hypothetical protein